MDYTAPQQSRSATGTDPGPGQGDHTSPLKKGGPPCQGGPPDTNVSFGFVELL